MAHHAGIMHLYIVFSPALPFFIFIFFLVDKIEEWRKVIWYLFPDRELVGIKAGGLSTLVSELKGWP